jgi:phage terminase small subunit
MEKGIRMALTARQETFVGEYLKDLNGTQAAIRAGYSEDTATQQASRLLTNVKVAAAVREAMDDRAQRTQITQDDVLTGIRDIVEATRQTQPSVALRGLELLGKHLGLFTDKHEIGGAVVHRIISNL